MSTKEKEIKLISKKDLKKGEIYTITDNHYLNKILIHKYEKMNDEDRSLGSFLTDFNDREEFRSQSTPYLTGRNISISTPEEKHWFLECEKADRFIPYDEAMKTFSKQNPFKFNIGDEIKAKPGGYYVCDPARFEEQHKISLPSNESGISGKITERTQAQGFNWYRCRCNNWITEEGIELIKEDIPEYVECYHLDRNGSDANFTIGKVYKVKDGSPIDDSGCHRKGLKVKEWEDWFKSSTKEAYDLQNETKMLPYPTDEKYFKAVVVKDIHKKDIIIQGNIPDLIPKGYQTWFISENTPWRERILSKEDVVCPENNRWGANIPAEYFQIVEDEKHNDIPKEEWIPQVGEYIVYNNTDVLKVTKVEPCKSHRYWITHTPNSFSGGGFGWNAWAHKIRKATLQEIESTVHPLTPKECYSSNEIIIPQIIKAQKTIQKITIESPTELDLKLKTIKPKQIQTIKI